MDNPAKPVVYITINGERFHWADSPTTTNAMITSFEFEDTDGTGKTNKKKKGKRDVLKFSFRDFDPETQSFISDRSMFKIGNIVRVKWGFEGEAPLSGEKVMKIASVEVTYPASGEEVATITCHDLSKDMNKKVKDLTRPKKKLQKNNDVEYVFHDVVKEIAEEDGFAEFWVDIDLGSIKTKGWQQKKETNIQFLQRKARDYGANVYTEVGKSSTSKKSVRTLLFTRKKQVIKKRIWGHIHRGMNAEFFEREQRGKRTVLIWSFSPKVDLEKAAKTVASSSISKKGVKEKEKSEETPETSYLNVNFGTGGLTPSDTPGAVATKDSKDKKLNQAPRGASDAKAKTEGAQQTSNDSAITASATTRGDPRLRAKITVISSGRIGKRWKNAKWYVSTCKHKMDSSGYVCNLDMTAPPKIAAKENKNVAEKAEKKKQDAAREDTLGVSASTGAFTDRKVEVKDRKTGDILSTTTTKLTK